MVNDHQWQSAIRIRSFEQRLLALFSQGRIFGTVHTCIGQEFTGVAIADALLEGDLIYSNHRCHGHYLARTLDTDGLMAELMGRKSGICGGRGGSQHICAHGVYSNGIQGGIVPVSAGLALAKKLDDSQNIVVVFIGDGTLGEGVVYEAMNIASKWSLPLLIVLENNLYAQSTPQAQNLSGEILKRPNAFGIKSYEGSIWNLDELFATSAQAAQFVREKGGPAFLKIDTYRLMAHSKGDDDRSKDEVGSYWDLDPITWLERNEPVKHSAFLRAVDDEIDLAVDKASQSPSTTYDLLPTPEPLKSRWTPTTFDIGKERVVSRIHAALEEAMGSDERVVCIGEDIEGPYGGAFKVTKNLSLKYPERVRNTPISEGAIVGITNGLALGGKLPVCEIMFGDFMTLAFDQVLNHASKFRDMYNDQVTVPVVIRTPMGGKRGYGATHSQSIEKHFLGIPDVSVLAIHHRYDPAKIYKNLFSHISNPHIVIENKILYGQYVSADAPDGYSWEATDSVFPTSRLSANRKPDLTVLCYGGMLLDVERTIDRLIDDHEIVAEVICPTLLFPLELDPILDSIQRSGRLLIVEEGQGFCAFGAEVIAQIVERLPKALTAVRRLSAAPRAIPSCKSAEEQLLPNEDSIINAALEVVHAV